MVESVREVIFRTDAKGRYTFLNSAWEEVTGFTVEESMGKSHPKFVYPEDSQRDLKDFEPLGGRGGDYVTYEASFLAKHGSRRDVEVKFRRHFDGEGRLISVSGTLDDITECKKTDRALQESEERFRRLFEQSVNAMYVHDERGRFLDCNSQACKLLGYSREELLSMSIKDVSYGLSTVEGPARQEQEIGELWQRILAGEPGDLCLDYEGDMVRKNGTSFPMEIHAGSVDYGGRRVVLAAARDITKRRETEAALRDSEERYRSVVGNLKEVVFQTDAQGAWRFLNPAWEEITSFPVQESLGEISLGYIHPEDRERAVELFRLLIERKKDHCRYEIRYLTREGGSRHIEVFARLTLNADGTTLGTSGTLNDITERKKAEEKLLQSEERFRGAFEHASTGMALVGLENRYLRVNPALCEMLGYSEKELLSKKSFDITHPEDLVKSRGRTSRTLEEDGPETMSIEKRYLRKDGGVVWMISAVSLVRDSEGEPSHFVAHYQDITEHKNLEERLFQQALHDPLTGLPNRNSLEKRFEQVARLAPGSLADSPGEACYVAVLFLDLDGFKRVNDSHGHAAGDELLRAVAERLRNVVRPEDTVARLGGDEFCVLLAEVSDTAEAVRIAGRLKESVDAPFSITFDPDAADTAGKPMVSISMSVGIAVSEPGRALDELLREADAAMYRAKKRGESLYEVVELTENRG